MKWMAGKPSPHAPSPLQLNANTIVALTTKLRNLRLVCIPRA